MQNSEITRIAVYCGTVYLPLPTVGGDGVGGGGTTLAHPVVTTLP